MMLAGECGDHGCDLFRHRRQRLHRQAPGARLLSRARRRESSISCATCRPSGSRALDAFWGDGAARAIAVKGDLLRPISALAADEIRKLQGRVDHFFHLAAIYDLAADPELETTDQCRGRAQRRRPRRSARRRGASIT